jgi:sarcosine oxidase subunit gamma
MSTGSESTAIEPAVAVSHARVDSLWIADVSVLERMGLKGPRAADWLVQAQVDVPREPNSWAPMTPGESSWHIVARLGTSEFFLEADAASSKLRELAGTVGAGLPQIYPVLREDRAFLLGGRDADDVLAQLCSVDFSSLDLETNPAVLTLLAGVAVLVIPQREAAGRRYRIWCDPTFGEFMWETLHDIVMESGGQRLDIEQLPDGPLPVNNERKR